MGNIPSARFARGLSVAMTLAVSITCASPTAPGRSESRAAQLDQLTTASSAGAITSVTVALSSSTVVVGEATVATATSRATTASASRPVATMR